MYSLKILPQSTQFLDDWIVKEVDFNVVLNIHDLGFKQLNDLLFCKYFYEIVQRMAKREKGDDYLLQHYNRLKQLDNIAAFDVKAYLRIVEEQLQKIPDISSTSKDEAAILFQNLIMVAFTIERWAQYVLNRPPGLTVQSIYMDTTQQVSLHAFLVHHIGNYNTLRRFALTSIAEVEGIYIPKLVDNKLVKGTLITAYSPYANNSSNKINRFPSILKLDDFPLVIKKGELIAQAYNTRIIELLSMLKTTSLDAAPVLNKVVEITTLFKTGIAIYKTFLKTSYFNEDKFIFILRQHTVELSLSPSEFLFAHLPLTKGEKHKIKGIINNYLTRSRLSARERYLFLMQVFDNETVKNPKLCNLIRAVLLDHDRSRYSELDQQLKETPEIYNHEFLSSLVIELLSNEQIGLYRLKYALSIAANLLPLYQSKIRDLLNNTTWLLEKLQSIVNTDYKLPPSGANSIAHLGPDILLGHYANIPNYSLHMINRLNVMISEDEKRFWEFQAHISSSLTSKLLESFEELPSKDNKAIAAYLTAYPWLKFYVNLYDSFALMSSTHDGIIEKYIRRLGKSMQKNIKDKLVSSPEHGTTYMKPQSLMIKQATANFPSLDAIAQVRRNHIFKHWVKPVRTIEKQTITKTPIINWFYSRTTQE